MIQVGESVEPQTPQPGVARRILRAVLTFWYGNRLRRRWDARQLSKRWSRMTPGQHIALLIDALNHSPELRRMMVKALHIDEVLKNSPIDERRSMREALAISEMFGQTRHGRR